MTPSKPTRILAAIVLYKTAPADSPALSSLMELATKHAWVRDQMACAVYDNSPEAQAMPPCALPATYVHDSSNPGLARPYNVALKQANQRQIPWLMLLDQDTFLTEAYLREMLDCTLAREADRHVAAFVPKLVEDGRVLSPHGPLRNPTPLAADFRGLAPGIICAFNSGSVLSVKGLVTSGGFDEEFPLDYLDHSTFHELQDRGKQVFVIEATLQHKLSLTNPLGFEDPSFARRYWASFIAEERYHRRFSTRADFWSHMVHRLNELKWLVWSRRWKRAFKHVRLTLGL